VAKVKKGLASALERVVKQIKPAQNYTLERVTVDTVGFSRGATAARHCVYRLLHSEPKGQPSFKRRLEALGFDVEKVEVQAVGIFDTVSALGVAYLDISDVKELHLDAVRDAKAVYHLAAAEEYRICFSLTNIDSAVNAGRGCEIFLPGAHSDVGGSYANGKSEEKALWTGDGSEELLDYLETYGWVRPGQARIVGRFDAVARRDDIWPIRPDNKGRSLKAGQAHLLSADRYAKMERPRISNRYSFIPLQLMAAFAREQGLSIKSKLEIDYDPLREPFPMTEDVVNMIKAYADQAKGTRSSLPEDWQRRTPTLNKLRNEHLHFSSGSAAGLNLRANLWDDFLDPWRRVYSDTA
jgi:hypothetical protein